MVGVRCERCGSFNRPEALHCARCGETDLYRVSAEETSCTSCNRHVVNWQIYCPECGKRLRKMSGMQVLAILMIFFLVVVPVLLLALAGAG